MGLPHVLVRFYTNPDGRAARRTAVVVLAMVGGFFVLVTLVGALSRLYTPQLLVNGQSDAAVLLVPTSALGSGWWGWLLGGLVAAGAGAAFLSTTVRAGGRAWPGCCSPTCCRGPLRHLRLAAVLALLPPFALALTVPRLDFAVTVPLVFAVAASTFCPLLRAGHLVAGADRPRRGGRGAGRRRWPAWPRSATAWSRGAGRAGWACCCTGRPRSPCRWRSW